MASRRAWLRRVARCKARFVGQQEAAMSEQEKKLDGPDFAQGVPFGNLAEGSMIVGHVAGEAVVLARTGGALFAIGAECTHYHDTLAEGCWWRIPSVARGTTPASVCAPERRCAPRR